MGQDMGADSYKLGEFQFQPNGTLLPELASAASSPGHDAIRNPLGEPESWSWGIDPVYSTPSVPGPLGMAPWADSGTDLWDTSMALPPQPGLQLPQLEVDYGSFLVPPEAFNLEQAQMVPQPALPPSSTYLNLPDMATPSQDEPKVPDIMTPDSAGRFSEQAISQSARDYLYVVQSSPAESSLELFFCPPRTPYGSEIFTKAQFRAKMSLPPSERPHPCLVFAMVSFRPDCVSLCSIRLPPRAPTSPASERYVIASSRSAVPSSKRRSRARIDCWTR